MVQRASGSTSSKSSPSQEKRLVSPKKKKRDHEDDSATSQQRARSSQSVQGRSMLNYGESSKSEPVFGQFVNLKNKNKGCSQFSPAKNRKHSVVKRLFRLQQLAVGRVKATDSKPNVRKIPLTRRFLRQISSFGPSKCVNVNKDTSSVVPMQPDMGKGLYGCGRSKIEYEESKAKLRKNLRSRFANNYAPAQIVPEKETSWRGETQTATATAAAAKAREDSNTSEAQESVDTEKSCSHDRSRPQKSFWLCPISSFSEVEPVEVEEEPVVKMKYGRVTFYGGKTESEKQHDQVICGLMQVQEYEETLEDIRRLKKQERKRQNAAIWKTTALFATIMATLGIEKNSEVTAEKDVGVVAQSDNSKRSRLKLSSRFDSGDDSGDDDDDDAALYDAVGRFRRQSIHF